MIPDLICFDFLTVLSLKYRLMNKLEAKLTEICFRISSTFLDKNHPILLRLVEVTMRAIADIVMQKPNFLNAILF